MATRQRSMRLTEPSQMRALAHPLRLRLLALLRTDGPATASALGERLGVTPALASYHLRQLGKHGFAGEAPELARDARERWWRAAHERTSWSTAEFLDTPERAAAEKALGRLLASAHAEQSARWVDEAATWPPAWGDAADMSDWILELTVDELRALRDELHAVVERRVGRPRSEGSEHVVAILHLLPRRRGTS